jgi:hypothetical protein
LTSCTKHFDGSVFATTFASVEQYDTMIFDTRRSMVVVVIPVVEVNDIHIPQGHEVHSSPCIVDSSGSDGKDPASQQHKVHYNLMIFHEDMIIQ